MRAYIWKGYPKSFSFSCGIEISRLYICSFKQIFYRTLSFGAPEFGKGISKLKQPLVLESGKGDISCSDNWW